VTLAELGFGGGLFTPTITSVSNVDATTARQCHYAATAATGGQYVQFSGQFDVDPTLNSTVTVIALSLPIASNFATAYQAGGTFGDGTTVTGKIYADATNDRIEFSFVSNSTSVTTFTFTLGYWVIPP
jgi:hypothetical protein